MKQKMGLITNPSLPTGLGTNVSHVVVKSWVPINVRGYFF